MSDWLNNLIDNLSDYLSQRKGLVPMLGILLILINLVLQFIPGVSGLAETDLFLHVGVIVSIIGLMLAWAL